MTPETLTSQQAAQQARRMEHIHQADIEPEPPHPVPVIELDELPEHDAE